MKIHHYIKNIKIILLTLQMLLLAFESLLGSLIIEWHFRYPYNRYYHHFPLLETA